MICCNDKDNNLKAWNFCLLIFYIHFQNPDLLWVENNPNLTICFKQTILIWVPCLFLWLFSGLDIMWRMKSRYSDIPWSFINLSKFLIIILLVALSITDLVILLSMVENEDVFPVQFVTIGIKIATFVSIICLHTYNKWNVIIIIMFRLDLRRRDPIST